MSNPGTSRYPGTLDTFDAPGTGTFEDTTGYEHDLLHGQDQDAIEKIETVIGTTAGTNVLKSFTAGQFPARVNAGGTIVQTLVGGTLNNTVIGTSAITGGTATSLSLGSPTITGTVGGTTIFTNFPETAGTPTTGNQLGNKTYIDSKVGARITAEYQTAAGTNSEYTDILIQTGIKSVIFGTTSTVNIGVTFPVAYDTFLSGQAVRGDTGVTRLLCEVHTVGVSGFTINLLTADSANTTGTFSVYWMAIGRKA